MGNHGSSAREVAGKREMQEWTLPRVRAALDRAKAVLMTTPPPLSPGARQRRDSSLPTSSFAPSTLATSSEPSGFGASDAAAPGARSAADADDLARNARDTADSAGGGTDAASDATGGVKGSGVGSGGGSGAAATADSAGVADADAHPSGDDGSDKPGVLEVPTHAPEDDMWYSWVQQFQTKLAALTRRQFWEIFTDYEMVRTVANDSANVRFRRARAQAARAENCFLSLDIAMFDLFTGAFGYGKPGLELARVRLRGTDRERADQGVDDDETVVSRSGTVSTVDTVNGFEVFLVLALFCSGNVDDQLALVFGLFDLDQSHEMDPDEMRVLLRTLTTACYKVGLTKREPDEEELDRLVAHMVRVADADNDGTISVEEFRKWARGHMSSQRLLTAFKRDKSHFVKYQLKPLDPGAGVSAATLARRKRLENSKVAKVASRSLLNKLSSQTKFDANELRRMRQVFSQVCSDEGEITREQFVRVMVVEYPSLRDGATVGKTPSDLRSVPSSIIMAENPQLCMLFDAFDEDLSGTMDFAEFSMGLSKLTRGTAQEKMAMLFEAYDADGDGTVSLPEIMKFVMKANDEVCEATEFASELLASMDTDYDGTLTKQEFMKAMKDEPMLAECFFGSLLPAKTRAVLESDHFQGAVQQVQMQNPRFTVDFLRRVWDRCVDKGEATKSMDRVMFRQFMVDEMQCGSEVLPIVNHVFRAMDTDGSGLVDFRELFSCLGQVVMGSTTEKAAFYFSLYDMDRSGDISTAEIQTMLASAREAANSGMAHVTDVLKGLGEASEDGNITRAQFQEACKTDPEMLEVFAQIFGAGNVETGASGDYNNQAKRQRVAASAREMSTKKKKEYHQIRSLLDGSNILSQATRKARKERQHLRAGPGGLVPSSIAAGVRLRERLALAQGKSQAQSCAERGLKALRKHSIGFSSKVVENLQEAVARRERRKEVAEAEAAAKEQAAKKASGARAAGAADDEPVYVPEPASLAAREHGRSLRSHFKRSFRNLKAAQGEEQQWRAHRRRADAHYEFNQKRLRRRTQSQPGLPGTASAKRAAAGRGKRTMTHAASSATVGAAAAGGVAGRGAAIAPGHRLKLSRQWESLGAISVVSVHDLSDMSLFGSRPGTPDIAAGSGQPATAFGAGIPGIGSLAGRSIRRISSSIALHQRAASAPPGSEVLQGSALSRGRSSHTLSRRKSSRRSVGRTHTPSPGPVSLHDVPPMVPPGSVAGKTARRRKLSLSASRRAVRDRRDAQTRTRPRSAAAGSRRFVVYDAHHHPSVAHAVQAVETPAVSDSDAEDARRAEADPNRYLGPTVELSLRRDDEGSASPTASAGPHRSALQPTPEPVRTSDAPLAFGEQHRDPTPNSSPSRKSPKARPRTAGSRPFMRLPPPQLDPRASPVAFPPSPAAASPSASLYGYAGGSWYSDTGLGLPGGGVSPDASGWARLAQAQIVAHSPTMRRQRQRQRVPSAGRHRVAVAVPHVVGSPFEGLTRALPTAAGRSSSRSLLQAAQRGSPSPESNSESRPQSRHSHSSAPSGGRPRTAGNARSSPGLRGGRGRGSGAEAGDGGGGVSSALFGRLVRGVSSQQLRDTPVAGIDTDDSALPASGGTAPSTPVARSGMPTPKRRQVMPQPTVVVAHQPRQSVPRALRGVAFTGQSDGGSTGASVLATTSQAAGALLHLDADSMV